MTPETGCGLCGKPSVCLRGPLCPKCLETGYGVMRKELLELRTWFILRADCVVFEAPTGPLYLNQANCLTKLLEQFPEQ